MLVCHQIYNAAQTSADMSMNKNASARPSISGFLLTLPFPRYVGTDTDEVQSESSMTERGKKIEIGGTDGLVPIMDPLINLCIWWISR